MTAPIESSTAAAAPEAVLSGVSSEAIEGRSLGQIAWLRLRRDKVAMAGGISLAHPLGVEPVNGRDLLARVVVGAQYSLLIAFLSTFLAVGLGVFFGVVAGYFGGWLDSLIARTMDVFLAFPLLVFALALVGVVPNKGFGLSGNSLRIVMLVFVIGFFNWPYMG